VTPLPPSAMDQANSNKVSLASHPTDADLEAYLNNTLLSSKVMALRQHVAKCQRCQCILDEFRAAGPDDVSNPTASQQKNSATQEKADQAVQKNNDQDRAALSAGHHSESSQAKRTAKIPEELKDHPVYKVLKRIGRGGMGEVFQVEHRLTNRKEVLKVIHSHLVDRADVRNRFKREIQSAAKLNHPNVVQTLNAIEEGNLLGLVMEYVQGESLTAIVSRQGPLTILQAREFIRQAANGLEHAHSHQMVHRDIKPQNLLVSKEVDGLRVRILDFGLAKTTGQLGTDSELTMDGHILGTPHFMSPEQALSPTNADIRSDIYSLGCTWFYLLTGKPPYEGDGALAILNAHQNAEIPLLSAFRQDVPKQTAECIRKMMAKRPEDRFQTPGELLQSIASESKTTASSSVRPVADMQEDDGIDPLSILPAPNPIASERLRAKNRKSQSSRLFQIAAFSLPTLVMMYVFYFRPDWIGHIQSRLSSIATETRNAPGTIIVKNLPSGMEIQVDGVLTQPEQGIEPQNSQIKLAAGEHALSVRRQGKEIWSRRVNLKERSELEVDLGFLPGIRESNRQSPKNEKEEASHEQAPNIEKRKELREPLDGKPLPSSGPKELPKSDPLPPTSVASETKEATKANEPEQPIVRGNTFSVQQRLVAHTSPVIRVYFMSDGTIISGETIGKAVPVKSKSTPINNHVFVWERNGKNHSRPSEDVFSDFCISPNGKGICQIGKLPNGGLSIQVFLDGNKLWASKLDAKDMFHGMPTVSFSMDAAEFAIANRRGGIERVNLKNRRPFPPVASLDNIDPSSVDSIAFSQKLDVAIYGLKTGEILAFGTRDGKRITPQNSIPTPLAGQPIALQLDPKEKKVVALYRDTRVCSYDFPVMTMPEDLQPSAKESVEIVGRSWNNRFLSYVDRSLQLVVWDLEEASLYAAWTLPKQDKPRSMAIENSGKRIAVGFESGTIQVFQIHRESNE
jgi:serine/threonine protein kinase